MRIELHDIAVNRFEIELKNESAKEFSGAVKFDFKNGEISSENMIAVFENKKTEYSLTVSPGES